LHNISKIYYQGGNAAAATTGVRIIDILKGNHTASLLIMQRSPVLIEYSNRTGSSILASAAQDSKIRGAPKAGKKWWPGTESNCRHGDFQSGINNKRQQITAIKTYR
jgi:hypothetical protein